MFILLLVAPATLLAIDESIWVIYSPGFWWALVELVLFALFLVTIIVSLIFFIVEVRKNIVSVVLAVLPLVLNAFLFYAYFNYDLEAFSRNRDFRRNLEAREEVVEMVESGKLKLKKNLGRGHYVILPDRYKHLTLESEQGILGVSKERGSIFFYTKNDR